MLPIVIRKFGNLVDVSHNGTRLTDEARRIIEPALTYTYQQRLFGYDKIDPTTGQTRHMRFETRRLFRYDDRGRLCCGAGLTPKLVDLLTKAKFSITLEEVEPDFLHPNRFETDWETVEDLFTFRPRQRECLEIITRSQFGVIDAPTGFGKGVLIAMLCTLYPKAKIDVVTSRKDVVEKTVRLLLGYLPNVGQVGAGKKELDRRITVVTADSLHHVDGEADIVLADEAHELMTPIRSRELAKYRFSRNFAFTATPEGRGDNADAKLESLFGPTVFKMEYDEAVKLGLVVPIIVEWLPIEMHTNPAKDKTDVAKKRWGIWRNHERNEAIANKAKSYEDMQTLILVETVEHALYLRKHLPDFQLCYADMSEADAAMYRRQGLLGPDEDIVRPAHREALRKGFESGAIRKVIATDVWSTGVDFTKLQVLIRADARGSDILDVQAPGRVCRISEIDKPHGIVVDCLDNFDSGLHQKALKRKRNYAELGWEQRVPKRRGRFTDATSTGDRS